MLNGYILVAVDKKRRCEWEVLGVHKSFDRAIRHAERLRRDHEKRQLWISNPNGMTCPECDGTGCEICSDMGIVTRWKVKDDPRTGKTYKAAKDRQDQDRGEG